jgi:hypothetical protein
MMRTARALIVAACLIAACGGDEARTNGSGGDDASTTGDDSGLHGTDGAGGGDDGGPSSCLGSSLLASLGKTRLLVGGSMADATASSTPIDLRYMYVSGGLFDGATPCTSCASGCTSKGKSCANSAGGCGWWGCWQWDQQPPGQYVKDFVANCAAATPKQVPMISYYEILHTSGAQEGKPEVLGRHVVTVPSGADLQFDASDGVDAQCIAISVDAR